MLEYYTACPACGAKVQLPDNEPDDPIKVTECDTCEAVFDYDPDEIETQTREADGSGI
jgi:hypothetical protein